MSHDSGYGREGRTVDRESLAACCETALSTAEEMAIETTGQPMIADDVLIGVSGAVLWSYVPAIQRRRADAPLPVSDEELDRVLHSLARTAQDYTDTLSRRAHLRMQLFSLSLPSIHLDGQWVTDPRGFLGEDLRARIFAAYAPRPYVDTLRFVADRLDLTISGLVALPQALVPAMAQPDGIVLKVGSTTTQVMQIEHRCPTWFDRFDIGGSAFTQEIIHQIGLLPERAEAAKTYYAEGGGDQNTRTVWKTVLAPVCVAWQNRLVEVLQRANPADPLPPAIIYCGGGSMLQDPFSVLAYNLQNQNLVFAQSPETRPFSLRSIRGWADRTTAKWDLGDVPAIGIALHAAMRERLGPMSERLSRVAEGYIN